MVKKKYKPQKQENIIRQGSILLLLTCFYLLTYYSHIIRDHYWFFYISCSTIRQIIEYNPIAQLYCLIELSIIFFKR